MRLDRWVRVSMALMVLVALGVTTAVVLAWLSDGASDDSAESDCSRMLDAQTKVSIIVSVDTEGLETPRITADLTVRMPTATMDDTVFIASPGSTANRSALRCMLQSWPIDDTDIRRQWRDMDPAVARDGPWLVLHDVVRVDLWGHPSDDHYAPRAVPVGLALVEPGDDETWHLSVHAPIALRLAEWQVVVQAPPGWLSAPSPRPASLEERRVAWAGLRPWTDQPLVTATLQLDIRTQVTAASSDSWGMWINVALSWLSGLLLAAIGLAFVRRRLPFASWRLALPPLILFGAVTAEWIARDIWAMYFLGQTWPRYEWLLSLAAVTLAGVCAWLWRIRLRVVLPAVVLALAVPTTMWCVNGWPWEGKWQFAAPAWWQVGLVNLCTVLIGSLLLLAGLFNALRLLRRDLRMELAEHIADGGQLAASGADVQSLSLRPREQSNEFTASTKLKRLLHAMRLAWRKFPGMPAWLWWTAAGMAILLVLERSILVAHRLRDWRRLDEVTNRDLCCPVAWHGWAQIEEATNGALIVTALVVGVMVLRQARKQVELSNDLVQVAVALFVMAVAEAEVWIFGYWIPLWPLLWLMLLRWLHHSKTASTVAPGWLALQAWRIGVRIAVPVALLWTALTWILYPPAMVDRYQSLIVELVVDAAWQAAVIAFGAGLLGLLWWRLPSTGMAKALPLIAVYVVPLVVIDVMPRLIGGPAETLVYFKAAMFAAAMAITAWIIQHRHLAPQAEESGQEIKKSRWRLWPADNAAEGISFLLTVVLSILAIVEFVSNGSFTGPPASIEPPRFGR